MRKSNSIVRFTDAELAAMQAKGKTSNWEEAATKPLPDGSDPDDAMGDLDWVTVALPVPRRKTHASLRIDTDVLDWFRGQGRGYQTKINAILRSYFEQNTR